MQVEDLLCRVQKDELLTVIVVSHDFLNMCFSFSTIMGLRSLPIKFRARDHQFSLINGFVHIHSIKIIAFNYATKNVTFLSIL